MTNDRYQILGPCGEGGMARVFQARDQKLDRLVAIKQMSPDLENDAEAVRAFEREARILAGLSDPNIVRVYDSFVDEGHHYFVMEYIEGEHLGKLIRRGASVDRAIRILEQVLSGIQSMHSHGIIHQDLKPSNILIDSRGIAKITDFGLATSSGEDGPLLDWGSVQYLAPEVYTGSYVQDARLDIYALGMVAYELFLGEKAFRTQCPEVYEVESEIPKRWVNWHQNPQQHFKLLSELNPEVQPYLAQIVARMLSKDRSRRYGDVGSILKDLNDKRQQEGVEEVEDDPNRTRKIGALAAKPSKESSPTPRPIAKKPGGSRKLLYAAGVFAIAMGGFLFFAATRPKPVGGSISSSPGAELSIDNQRWGPIPQSGTMRGHLMPGPHGARLTLQDYEPFETTMVVKASTRWMINAPLKPSKPPVSEVPTRLNLPSGAMILIPAGEFLYGKDNKKTTLPAFYIDEIEVTNFAYRQFCEATKHPTPPNPVWDNEYFQTKERYPVVNVTFDDAVAYARWAGKRLPAELEWEKAARGADGRTWPWGNQFDTGKANLGGATDGYTYTAPAGSFPGGASPYGVLDMAGNVWEWVADAYGFRAPGPNDRAVKGGAFVAAVGPDSATTFFHGAMPRNEKPGSIGFRCAKDVSVSQPAGVGARQP
jgi:eukaryotic-like serine/threonine-protein kinase